MPDFLRSLYKIFLKQKSKLFLAVLFLVLAGILIPTLQPASAAWINWGCLGGVVGCVVGHQAGPNSPFNKITIEGFVESVTKGIVGALLAVPLLISHVFTVAIKTLLEWAMTTPVTYISSTAVTLGWPIARDFANMLIVLALIIISLATIVRYQAYEAKKLLPTLIIAALLVNFSLVICGIFIDGSNIIMKGFLDKRDQSLTSNIEKLVKEDVTNDSTITFSMRIIGKIFYNTMTGLVLMLYLFLFLFRIFALWVLLILSPLAFACYILPNTRQYFTMWWNNFFQWCMIGIAGGFFYMIASKLQNQLTIAKPVTGGGDTLSGLVDAFAFIVPGAFLAVGFLASLQTSAMGSSMAISAFKKTAGALRTGGAATGKFVGKFAADRFGLTYGYQEAKSGILSKLEKIPFGVGNLFGGRGTQASKKASESEADMKKYSSKDRMEKEGRSGRKTILNNVPINGGTHATAQEKADYQAAAEHSLANGQFKDLDPKKQKEVLAYLTATTGRTDWHSKAGPEHAANDTDKVNKILADQNPGIDPKQTRANAKYDNSGKPLNKEAKDIEAVKEQSIRDAYDRMDTKYMDDMNDTDLLKLAEKETAEGAKALEKVIKKGIVSKVKGNDPAEIGELLNKATKYGSNARKGAEKLDPRLALSNFEGATKLVDEGKAPDLVSAQDQLLSEVYEKLNVSEIRAMETEAFNEDFVINTTAKKIGEAGKDLGRGKIAKLKDLLPALRQAENDARALGTPEGNKIADELSKKHNMINAL